MSGELATILTSSFCLQNSRGQTIFHVIADSTVSSPADVNYLSAMLRKDVAALVTLVDHAGWTAVHYAG